MVRQKSIKEFVQQLARLAGLTHDIGKTYHHFQRKLLDDAPRADIVRHEMISCYWLASLFLESISDDGEVATLMRAADKIEAGEDVRLSHNAHMVMESIISNQEEYPAMSSLLSLVLTHHLALDQSENIGLATEQGVEKRYFNESSATHVDMDEISKLYENQKHVASNPELAKNLSETFRLLAAAEQSIKDCLNEDFMTHLAGSLVKPALISADWKVSGVGAKFEPERQKKSFFSFIPFANSFKDEKNARFLAQTLEEHLLGVGSMAYEAAGHVFELNYENSVLGVFSKSLSQSVPEKLKKKFGWQDSAVTSVEMSIKEKDFGYIGFVMAETGSGKTRGNAKLLNAVSPNGINASFLLGMKSLTMQTSKEFNEEVKLAGVATVIGDSHTEELFKLNNSTGAENYERVNSEERSIFEVFAENGIFREVPEFFPIKPGSKMEKLFSSPVTVSTVDYFVRGLSNKHASHSLSLLLMMGKDLIIDEADDYDSSQIINLSRMIEIAGSYGRKVIVSSATLTKDILELFINSYNKGFDNYCIVNGETPSYVGAYTHFRGLERTQRSEIFDLDGFIEEFKAELEKNSRKKMEILDIRKSTGGKFGVHNAINAIFNKVQSKRDEFNFYYPSDHEIKVNTAIVKFSNVKHLQDLYRYLSMPHILDLPQYKDDLIIFDFYHSRDFEIKKSYKEKVYSTIFNRKDEQAFQQSDIVQSMRKRAAEAGKKNVIFILFASPIVETGRDYDADMFFSEARDHRSSVQGPGRALRHRALVDGYIPVVILSHSLRIFDSSSISPYSLPGFNENRATFVRGNFDEEIENGSYDSIFLFKEGSVISSAPLLDCEHQNSYARQREVEQFRNKVNSLSSIDGSQHLSTNKFASKFEFRESEAKKDLVRNEKGEYYEPEYSGKSPDATVQNGACTLPKKNLLHEKSLEEIIEGYGYDYLDYMSSKKLAISLNYPKGEGAYTYLEGFGFFSVGS